MLKKVSDICRILNFLCILLAMGWWILVGIDMLPVQLFWKIVFGLAGIGICLGSGMRMLDEVGKDDKS